jgi:hypothetical protein
MALATSGVARGPPVRWVGLQATSKVAGSGSDHLWGGLRATHEVGVAQATIEVVGVTFFKLIN